MSFKANPNVVCQHIDVPRLYTDPQYRFEYLAKFSGFGKEDIDAIHKAAPAVAPLVPGLVDAIYEKLFSFDSTKEVFLQRNEGFDGKLAADLDHLKLDHEQILYRKKRLAGYLEKLVTGKYDAGFVKYLDWVGKIHTAASGKASKINVDYVHCSALFIFVSSAIIDALMSAGLPHDVEKKTVLAFNKLLWIQNDFFAKWYVRDGAQYTGLGSTGMNDVVAFGKSGAHGWAVLGAWSVAVAAASVAVFGKMNMS